MRATLPLLASIAIACNPQHPTPQGVAVTGACAHTLTKQDRADLDTRIANARQCMRENGFKIKNRVKEIRVHCGCPQFRYGTHMMAGTSNERDRIELEWRRIEVEHESVAVMFGDHGPLDHSDPTHPSIVCGEGPKRAWYAEHPRPTCKD